MIHMETVRLTASQALVRFLENQYISYIDMDGNEQEHKFVKGIFMLPGHGNVVGFANGVEQELKDMIVYQGKNEQGMALAAVGYAKQMRRKSIFACTSSVGPGACNMVTAAATATANNIPVLILPGDIYASRQPDPVLQQMEQPQNLSISAHDAFQAVTKYWGRIIRPEQVMTDMISAMRVLTDTANTGAVAISLPQDVQAEAYDYPVDFFKKRVWTIERRPATKKAAKKAAEIIKSAKKPLLICGGGVGCGDDIVDGANAGADAVACAAVLLFMRGAGYSYGGYWFACCNLLVGGSNLLPLPGLDGWRIAGALHGIGRT